MEELSPEIILRRAYSRHAKIKKDIDLAKALGKHQAMISTWRSRKKIPYSQIVNIARELDLSLNYLLNGEDVDFAVSSPSFIDTSMPIYGLSSCGDGILKATHIQMKTSKQMMLTEKAYGIFTIGDSLTPMGINPGMMCFCDPSLDPVEGDIIHIIRNDDTSMLKRFDGYIDISGHRAMAVTGFGECDTHGIAEDFATSESIQPTKYIAEKLDIDLIQVKSIAPVVYVRRKV